MCALELFKHRQLPVYTLNISLLALSLALGLLCIVQFVERRLELLQGAARRRTDGRLSWGSELLVWWVGHETVVLFSGLGATEIARQALWMIREASDEALLDLRVGNAECEFKSLVDLVEQLLKLMFFDEDEQLARINAPYVEPSSSKCSAHEEVR